MYKNYIRYQINRIKAINDKIQSEKAENERITAEERKIYLVNIVNQNEAERLKIIKDSEKELVEICRIVSTELKHKKEKYLSSLFKSTPEYEKDYSRLVQLGNPKKFIQFLTKNKDVTALEFLLDEESTSNKQKELNLLIRKAIKEVQTDNITIAIDKITNLLDTGLSSSMVNGTVKFILKDDFIDSLELEEVIPFNAKEYGEYRKNANPTEQDKLKAKAFEENVRLKNTGEPYNDIIDQV